jgi:PAS domain S-box-containing protein
LAEKQPVSPEGDAWIRARAWSCVALFAVAFIVDCAAFALTRPTSLEVLAPFFLVVLVQLVTVASIYAAAKAGRQEGRREAGAAVSANAKKTVATSDVAISEARFRGIVEHSLDLVMLLRPDGRVAYASPSSAMVLGRTPAEIEGKPWAYAHPDDATKAAGILRVALGGAVSGRDLEYRLMPAEGGVRWVSHSWSAMPALGRNGDDKLSLHVIRDITERKQAEAERQTLGMQLAQSSKLATVGTLASGVAHELNNPLTAVLAFSEMIAKDEPPETQTAIRIQKVIKAAGRMRRIIDHLRTYARASRREDKRLVDLRESVRAAVDMLEHQLRGKSISVQLELQTPCWLYGDVVELETVFQNLLINSRDAFDNVKDDRARIISIKAHVKDDRVGVEYEDNATGMPEAVSQHIFDTFFTTKEPGKGTGLGMAMVARILRTHDGTIEVESEEGRGSRFRLSFRAAEAPEVAAPVQDEVPVSTEPRAVSDASDAALRPAVLIVDDEEHVTEVLSLLLRSDFELTLCNDPRTAMGLVETGHFELMLTDVRMPGVSGFELAAHARRRAPQTQVVLMSGHVEAGAAVRKEAPHASGFLPKPFPPEERLRTYLKSCLPKRVA